MNQGFQLGSKLGIYVFAGLVIIVLWGEAFQKDGLGVYMSSFAALIFGIYYINKLLRNPAFFIFLFPVSSCYAWFVASSLMLEFGAYTPELQMSGSAIGATARLSLTTLLFISPAIKFFYRISKTSSDVQNGFPRRYREKICLVTFFYFITSISVLLIYIKYGTAFSNSVDRIQYRQQIAPPIYSQLLLILVFMSFFIGKTRQIIAGHKKRLCDLLIVVTIFLLALGGEKASLIFCSVSLYASAIVGCDKFIFSKRNVFRFAASALVIIATVYYLATIQYNRISSESSAADVAASLFIDRIAQQSQLNYYFDKIVFLDRSPPLGLQDFIYKELLPGKDENLRGILALMSKAAPSDLIPIYLDAGVTFGDGFPAIFYYYFGWSTFPLAYICGVFFGAFTGLAYRECSKFNVGAGFLLLFLVYNTFLSVFLNGEFHLIFDLSTSKLIAISMLLFLFFSRKTTLSLRSKVNYD